MESLLSVEVEFTPEEEEEVTVEVDTSLFTTLELDVSSGFLVSFLLVATKV